MNKWLLSLCLVTTLAHAEDTSFVHKEWEVVCDNTRTCRAVGFRGDDADDFSSLLLTRQAGQGQQITADIRRAETIEGDEGRHFPKMSELYIDDNYAGPMHFDDEDKARLTPHQTQSIVKAVMSERAIKITSGTHEFIIPSEGGYAAMLDMDTVQGRLGSTSAVTRRGTRTDVLPALPVPVIERKPMYRLDDMSKWDRVINVAALKKEVLAETQDRCNFGDPEGGEFEPTVQAQLTPEALLVGAPCVRSVENIDIGFWRINTQPPYQPEEIVLDASGFTETGDIVADVIAGGYGDCVSRRQWAWTGEAFELTSENGMGRCTFIHMSSGWELPTFVSVVK